MLRLRSLLGNVRTQQLCKQYSHLFGTELNKLRDEDLKSHRKQTKVTFSVTLFTLCSVRLIVAKFALSIRSAELSCLLSYIVNRRKRRGSF